VAADNCHLNNNPIHKRKMCLAPILYYFAAASVVVVVMMRVMVTTKSAKTSLS